MKPPSEAWPPLPRPGLVIAYSYLWHREFMQGEDAGRKDRPCLLLSVVGQRATVLPITSRPGSQVAGLALDADLRSALKLPRDASFLVYEEVNHFTWPGPDLRRPKGGGGAYGQLPSRLLYRIQGEVLALAKARRLRGAGRDE